VLALDPRRPGIHYRLGRTLLARARQFTSSEDLASAQSEFEQELAADPLNGNAAYEMAEAHRNEGPLEEAQKLFERALKSHPDFEEAQLGLASVLMSQQKPQQALPHLQKAIELNPKNAVCIGFRKSKGHWEIAEKRRTR
jgi:tetratricopeptide (TPR) repeat protein